MVARSGNAVVRLAAVSPSLAVSSSRDMPRVEGTQQTFNTHYTVGVLGESATFYHGMYCVFIAQQFFN